MKQSNVWLILIRTSIISSGFFCGILIVLFGYWHGEALPIKFNFVDGDWYGVQGKMFVTRRKFRVLKQDIKCTASHFFINNGNNYHFLAPVDLPPADRKEYDIIVPLILPADIQPGKYEYHNIFRCALNPLRIVNIPAPVLAVVVYPARNKILPKPEN